MYAYFLAMKFRLPRLFQVLLRIAFLLQIFFFFPFAFLLAFRCAAHRTSLLLALLLSLSAGWPLLLDWSCRSVVFAARNEGNYFSKGPKTLQKVPPKKRLFKRPPKNNGAFFRGEKKSNMCRRRRVFPLRRTKERSGREKRFAFSKCLRSE